MEPAAEKLTPAMLKAATEKAAATVERYASTDFPCFLRTVIKDEKTQLPIELADIHLEWIAHVERCRKAGLYALILAPPESGKSQIFAIGLPAFEAGGNNLITMLALMADKVEAKKRIRPTREIIELDPDFRRVFPDCHPGSMDKWSENELVVSRPHGIKDPTYAAYGIRKPPQGARVALMIGDDVCDYANTISEPAMRKKVIELWDNGFDTRLGPDSMVVYIGGVIHNQDLTSKLMEDPRFWGIMQSISDDFTHYVQTDLRTKEKKKIPLWPRAHTPDFLQKKHAANPRAYERAYKHKGYTDEEKTFDWDAINAAISPLGVVGNGVRYTGVDLSSKTRPGNVIITLEVTPETLKRRVLDIRSGFWTSPQTANEIIGVYKKYRPDFVAVENNAYQGSLQEWIEATAKIQVPIEAFHTGKQKADEELGIRGFAAEVKSGMWSIPDPGHPAGFGCECEPCKFITELREHPFSETTDHVMAAWFARHLAKKYGGEANVDFSDPEPSKRGVRGRDRQQDSQLARMRQRRKGRR